jgi:transcriptional regulator GlxA family with amidase domain
VRRAVELMHTRPDLAHAPASLAAAAGISVRSLHEAFRYHIGMTPMTYLRQLRLQHAHDELLRGEPTDSTVTDIAHRWGFVHLSRFARSTSNATGSLLPSRCAHGAKI